jgi:hypothetical protein
MRAIATGQFLRHPARAPPDLPPRFVKRRTRMVRNVTLIQQPRTGVEQIRGPADVWRGGLWQNGRDAKCRFRHTERALPGNML